MIGATPVKETWPIRRITAPTIAAETAYATKLRLHIHSVPLIADELCCHFDPFDYAMILTVHGCAQGRLYKEEEKSLTRDVTRKATARDFSLRSK